ncbi:MAG: hypothetical protein ABEJ95_05415 [Candidatus Nanohalobium sp.]
MRTYCNGDRATVDDRCVEYIPEDCQASNQEVLADTVRDDLT